MPGSVFDRGDRVTLNAIRPEDYAFVEEQFNDPQTRRQAGVSLPWSEKKVTDFVEETDDVVQFLVCRDGSPIGHVVLAALDTQASNAELGWVVVAPDERGNGYATEAVELCLGHAFDDRGLHKVWANVNEDNEASRRLLENVGFQREGVLREQEYADGEYVDVHRYGLLVSEW